MVERLGVLALVVAWMTVPMGVALAKEPVFRFAFQEQVNDETSLPECLPPDLIGTVTGTETTVGQGTDTGRTFQVHGTTTFEYRVDFPDGRFVIGISSEHFGFRYNGTPTQTNSTSTGPETRTVYSASGDPIGRVMIHAVSHITFRDANGNDAPDPGEISSSVDRFFFTCH